MLKIYIKLEEVCKEACVGELKHALKIIKTSLYLCKRYNGVQLAEMILNLCSGVVFEKFWKCSGKILLRRNSEFCM